jgi:DNA-directed RNA polymerase specialized sigma24 family protein
MTERPELSALPETYALALRLSAEGLDDDAIARILKIEAESVAPLLALARSKLADLARRREGQHGGTEAQ